MTRARRVRLALVLLLLLVLGGALLWRSPGPTIEPGSTLVVVLSGSYPETGEAPLVAQFLGDRQQPLASILSLLALAERDDRLETVVLRIHSLQIGWGKADELRAAIGRLRDAGRKTVAVLEVASFGASREYFVACAADEVHIVPGATVPLVGLAAEYYFLGGLFERAGIGFDVVRAGQYKSATEFFTEREMSEANRRMADGLLDSVDALFVDGIAKGRGLEPQAVRSAIDTAPVLAGQLLGLGLIDGVTHLDPLLEEIGAPVVRQREYARIDPADVGFDPVARFALVYGSGTVVMGEGTHGRTGSPVFAAETVSRALVEAAEDPEIEAIIFRIDSPGGSAVAAEIVWRAVKEARTHDKPVIASFSDVAASGGYYAAAAADAIVAPPGAITGSIGAFALRPTYAALLDKLEIGTARLTRGRHADLLLSGDRLSQGSYQRLQDWIVEAYALFVERVSEGRSLSPQEVDAIGQGRVWTGVQAYERKLVDELGGLRTAVDRARSSLDLSADDDVVLVPYPAPRGLTEQLAELLQSRVAALAAARVPLPDPVASLRDWLVDLPAEGVVMMLPWQVDIR